MYPLPTGFLQANAKAGNPYDAINLYIGNYLAVVKRWGDVNFSESPRLPHLIVKSGFDVVEKRSKMLW